MFTDTARPLPHICGPPLKASCPRTDSTWEAMSPWRNSWGLGPSRPAIRCWRSREKTIRWSSFRYSLSRFFCHANHLAPSPCTRFIPMSFSGKVFSRRPRERNGRHGGPLDRRFDVHDGLRKGFRRRSVATECLVEGQTNGVAATKR